MFSDGKENGMDSPEPNETLTRTGVPYQRGHKHEARTPGERQPQSLMRGNAAKQKRALPFPGVVIK